VFNRIAFAWVWALVFVVGLRFPLITGKHHGLYMIVLSALLVIQLFFIVFMVQRQYHHFQQERGLFKYAGQRLEEQALLDASDGRLRYDR
jgi:hypothetical protein